jgi:thioredoxin reductase (NADPH)
MAHGDSGALAPCDKSLKGTAMPSRHAPVLIIGSGPAGYTAAVYAARAMLKPLLVAGLEQGGQLTITTDVENYPGFADPIQGPWLMEQMLKQAENVGTEIANDIIVDVDLKVRPFRLRGDSGTEYTCDALIVATGAKAKWLGIPSEQTYMGFGVSACATCDGFFYRGKDVVVIGGGNTAVEEALYLSNLASHVTIIHRRDEFRAERILQERLFSKDNITVMWDTVVDEITGAEAKAPMPASVNGIRLKNVRTNEVSDMPVDGVFVAIGHAPAVELFEGKLKHKPNGYLWTAPDSTQTDVPGVFAAGDVTDDIYRQAVTAAGLGCMAALEAERYLASAEMRHEAAEQAVSAA